MIANSLYKSSFLPRLDAPRCGNILHPQKFNKESENDGFPQGISFSRLLIFRFHIKPQGCNHDDCTSPHKLVPSRNQIEDVFHITHVVCVIRSFMSIKWHPPKNSLGTAFYIYGPRNWRLISRGDSTRTPQGTWDFQLPILYSHFRIP